MKNQSKHFLMLLAISCTILLSCQKVEKGFADINGTSIYYEVKGDGVPVILMHGFACDTRYWDNQFELFSENYEECFLNIECKVIDQLVTGDHTVFVAKPVALPGICGKKNQL